MGALHVGICMGSLIALGHLVVKAQRTIHADLRDQWYLHASGSRPNVPPQELEALHNLYNATNGNDWAWLDPFYGGVPWIFNATSNPCAQDWQGILCSNTAVNGYLNVVKLDLYERNLRGLLPESIGNLTKVTFLNLAENWLSGTIPETLGQLTSVVYFNLENNELNGTIPNSLSNLAEVESIYLSINLLTGTLPQSIGTLQHLSILALQDNLLYGTIPHSYCDLSMLTELSVGYNTLFGTIPYNIGQLTALTTLALNSNYLEGTIPESMSNLRNIMYIYLDYNGFYGTIPASFGNFTVLQYIIVNENYLTGTIPRSLAQIDSLLSASLHTNKLTGTVPAEFAERPLLELLDLHSNKLVGTIPTEFGDVASLQVLKLFSNFLTGTIPASLSRLVGLQNLDFSANYLTGTFPPELCQLTACVSLKIHITTLVGTVPNCISNMTALNYLSLHTNHFTSTIPSGISQLTALNSFYMFSNQFTGNVAAFINATAQVNLAIVEISGNQLTGQLPDDLFRLPQLRTLAVVSNCFHGTIPTSTCDSTTIKTLSLDGLRTGSSCQDVIFPQWSKSYILSRHFKQGVPSCLFEIPTLNTLHLSGNGLTGSLPNDVQISPNLVDISLSYNELTGTIPRIFQERIYYNFDLSYNKFTGTLTQAFATVPGNLTLFDYLDLETVSATDDIAYVIPNAALSLRNNRLSHAIPPVVQDMLNVSVLQGNLFGCLLDESDLPAHDNGKDTYQCGSTSFNISYYVFVAVLGFLVFILAVAFRCRNKSRTASKLLQLSAEWLGRAELLYGDGSGAPFMRSYQHFVILSDNICKVAMVFTVCSVVVFLPVHAALSKYSGTHTYEYAWAVSGTFLSGEVPFAVLLVLYTCLVAAVAHAVTLLRVRMRISASNLQAVVPAPAATADPEHSAATNQRAKRVAIYLLFALLNVAVVVGANFAYVYTALYANSTYIIIAQVAMSVFKLVWNSFFARKLTLWTDHYLASSAADGVRSHDFFAVQLGVMLFNFIAVPCIVVGAISPDCFANLAVAPSRVSSYFYYESCSVYSPLFGCLTYKPLVASTSYSPPFTYSYECSSSLITYYSPTFVFLGLFVTFGIPLFDLLLCQLHARATPDSEWFIFLDKYVPQLLRHLTAQSAENIAPYSPYRPIFNANFLLVIIMSYLGVLLTFGVLFPPVAVVMLLSICSMVWVAKLKVGRFLHNTATLNIHKYSEIIDSECRGVGLCSQLNQCGWQLVSICCLFYMLFLFDTLGDAAGFESSFWVLIVVPLAPVAAYGCVVLTRYLQAARPLGDDIKADGVEIVAVMHKGNPRADQEQGAENATELAFVNETFNVLQSA